LTSIAPIAVERGAWRALFDIVARAFRHGRPTATHYAVLAGASLLGKGTRRALRREFGSPRLSAEG
jgi:hypothetical protein